MTDSVDQMVDDSLATDQPVEAQENEDITEGQEEAPQEQPEEAFTPWPKTAENAVNRLKQQRAKYQSEIQELRTSYQKMESDFQALKNPAPQEPQEDDFENYGDYLKAVAKFGSQPNQASEEKPLSREEIYRQVQEETHYNGRAQSMHTQAKKTAQEVPDYAHLHAQYEDVMDNLPEATQKAFLDTDDAPAAFYALAKSGQLEALTSMPPHLAAMAIARAELQGQQLIQSQKQKSTNAPAPMTGVKGSSSVIPDEELSGKELLKKHGVKS